MRVRRIEMGYWCVRIWNEDFSHAPAAESRRAGELSRPCFVPRPTRFVLVGDHPLGGRHPLRPDPRVDECRILALEVRLGHPTGDGAAPSDIDGYFVLDQFAEDLANRRPADTDRALCHRLMHEDDSIAHEEQFDLMAFV